MDLMDTPLGDEVNRIIDSKQGTPNVFIDATIHTLSGDIPVLKVLNHDIVREYAHQYSDEISLVVLVPAGQMAYKVLPSRNQLEITLTTSRAAQHGLLDVSDQDHSQERFRAVLKKANDPTLEAKSRELLGEMTMDIASFDIVELQLFSKAMEQFGMLGCGGIYRRTKIADLIRTLLLQQSQNIKVDDDYKPLGVDMVETVDTSVREHIVLPHGMKTYDMPAYIHKHCGGIYSAGMSYFYQDDYWYIYPTYDYKKFEEASRQLVIVQIPEGKFPNLDYTYMKEGTVVSIVATGELQLDDTSDIQKRSTGNGVRFADAGKLFEDGVQVVDNKATVSRGKTNNEFISSKQKSDFNNVEVSSNHITSNVMFESSKLASKEGVMVQLIWQNADPALIYPGMKTKISYYKNGQINQLYAVVLATHTSTTYQGQGLITGRYNRNTALLLFCANEANQ